MKTAKHEKYNISHVTLNLCLAAVLLITSSYAWFVGFAERKESTQAISVLEPPILYILDSDATDMTQLSLRGLKIGETKRLVFCVSSVYPVNNDTVGYKGPFSLELAYTQNLSAKYNLYIADIKNTPAEDSLEYTSQAGVTSYFTPGSKLSYTDISDVGNSYAYGSDYSSVQEKNKSKYIKYTSSNNESDENFNLRFTASNNNTGIYNTINCRFFILEITWGDTLNVDSKETDMIYIIAKSGGKNE